MQIGSLGGIEALAALRSGADVMLLAAVGDDADGRVLRDLLHQHGLDARLETCADAPTGSGATFLDDAGAHAHVCALAANALLDAGEEAMRLLESATLLLCQCEANPRASGLLMARARERGLRSVLHAGPMRPDAMRVLAPNADLVVTGDRGLSELVRIFNPSGLGDFTGEQIHGLSDARLHELCRATLPCDIVVLLGARGAFMSSKDGAFKLQGDARASVSRPALRCAEETFVGALCARLHDGESLLHAVRFAITAAAVMPLPGGQENIPRKAEVLAALVERQGDY
jgi:ribokinase